MQKNDKKLKHKVVLANKKKEKTNSEKNFCFSCGCFQGGTAGPGGFGN